MRGPQEKPETSQELLGRGGFLQFRRPEVGNKSFQKFAKPVVDTRPSFMDRKPLGTINLWAPGGPEKPLVRVHVKASGFESGTALLTLLPVRYQHDLTDHASASK